MLQAKVYYRRFLLNRDVMRRDDQFIDLALFDQLFKRLGMVNPYPIDDLAHLLRVIINKADDDLVGRMIMIQRALGGDSYITCAVNDGLPAADPHVLNIQKEELDGRAVGYQQ